MKIMSSMETPMMKIKNQSSLESLISFCHKFMGLSHPTKLISNGRFAMSNEKHSLGFVSHKTSSVGKKKKLGCRLWGVCCHLHCPKVDVQVHQPYNTQTPWCKVPLDPAISYCRCKTPHVSPKTSPSNFPPKHSHTKMTEHPHPYVLHSNHHTIIPFPIEHNVVCGQIIVLHISFMQNLHDPYQSLSQLYHVQP